jgi:hypothetical protein
VLDFRFLSRGPLRSGEAGPDPGLPQALAGGLQLSVGHSGVVGVDDSQYCLDLLGPELEESN